LSYFRFWQAPVQKIFCYPEWCINETTKPYDFKDSLESTNQVWFGKEE